MPCLLYTVLMSFNHPFWTRSAPTPGGMDEHEIAVAKERGRQGAVAILLNDPVKKAEAEAAFGLAFMKARYPEAYRNTAQRWVDNLLWWSTS